MSHYTRKTLPHEFADTERWPKADLTQCDDAARQRFDALSTALRRYLKFEPMACYLKAAGLAHAQVLRALDRCVAPDGAGGIYGWRALLKYVHTSDYIRHVPVAPHERLTRAGYAGALQHFWCEHPDVRVNFDRYLRTRRRGRAIPEPNISPHAAHAHFIELCGAEGITDQQWPLCTESYGRGAITAYVKSFLDRHYDQVVLTQYGEKAQARSETGTGYPSRLRSVLPLDVVEIDEHKAHFIGAIGITTPKGRRWVPVQRVTLLVAVDRASETILSYVAIFRREARESDLLKLIALALRPWTCRTLSLPGLSYPNRAGFPSSSVKGLECCGWAMLLFDNALIHLAHGIVERARRMTGAAINFGPVKHFSRRPIVENVFRQLERAGFERVPSTTGTGPTDPHRQQPEAKAVQFKISEEAALDLIEVALAARNGEPNSGTFALSGLDYLRSVVSDPTLCYLAPSLPPRLPGDPDLDATVEAGVIVGSQRRGERPHITLDGAAYTNPALARRWDLLGTRVRKYIHDDDIRSFEARVEDGPSLGTVTVVGRWSHSAHSRETRRLINAAVRRGKLMFAIHDDPVAAWRRSLAEAAQGAGGSLENTRTTREASQLAEERRVTRQANPGNDGGAPTASALGRMCTPTTAERVRNEPLASRAHLRAIN